MLILDISMIDVSIGQTIYQKNPEKSMNIATTAPSESVSPP